VTPLRAGDGTWRGSLRRVSLHGAGQLQAGRRPLTPPRWHPQYPMADSLLALETVRAAHLAVGWDGLRVPDWWLYQIVVGGQVVGDAGFHGPLDVTAGVEIGYAVVPALRGRGIAGRACRELVAHAWHHGAARVLATAEPANLASRRLLLSAGFVPTEHDCYVLERVGRAG
jgi:RimJ/RimL family protein N-acetyltransferase